MIALVNYGLGNIAAFVNVYKRLNLPVAIASTPEALRQASRIILPGVGAFDGAMERLDQSGLRACLDEMVLERKVPVLGVCVGMQIMAHRSEEGRRAGLGWIDAEVRKFDVSTFTQPTHLPHMGWNDVAPKSKDSLFKGLERPRFYFLHSYYFASAREEDALAVTEYGASFVSAVRAGNVYGVQFHPEKSHHWGTGLLQNFAEI